MTRDQAAILAVLAVTVAMFVWGRWRHDMVALGALLACVAVGLVPGAEAFLGFGHPAVVTVAAVLVLSGALQSSGAVDALARVALPRSAGPTMTTAALTGLAAVLSGFMNNVGALALLMPLAVQTAARQGLPPGKLLMPLAFGSILGGMTTLIGTPPNLIVSGFRAAQSGASFAMFDFTPVGLAVAAVGVLFVVLLGHRLVPARSGAGGIGFETGAYLTEARVAEDSKAAGRSLHEVDRELEDADAQVVGLIRDGTPIPAPGPSLPVRPGDILVIEAEPAALASALSALGLRLEEDVGEVAASAKEAGDPGAGAGRGRGPARGTEAKVARGGTLEAIRSGDVTLVELTVLPRSDLVGRSAADIRLRARYGINLLAVARQGRHSIARLRTLPIAAGDVLLMQGRTEAMGDFAARFGCVPLADRPLRIPNARRALAAGGTMAVAVGAAAFGLVPAAIAFAAGVLGVTALRVVPPRRVYEAVDWPVVVLLGALIPVAGAMATTGAADLVARLVLEGLARGHAVVALALVLAATMTLSDFMNNAATAAVMCPIAIQAADRLGASADPFLMAVAIGASCAFLTPVGHQNNTLILGPGGFRFGDYWRLGLPLEIVVVAVALPLLLLVWPP
jgi:di/tricarboxylate transporter